MFRIIICALLASFVSMGSMAQGQGGDLPVDPNVRIGTLDNGLTYYLRNNQKPKNRVELRLVIDAGSLQEDDDQQGLAHFLEHMAFNGTENFAANDLVDYLESIGARFGPDLNAYTSFDETVYMLEIPTDEEGLVDKGFSILRDWASRITIDEAEVEKERGVVLEEWRLGLGASERLRQVHWPVLFQDSRYAKRLPIGKPEVIEQAPRQRLEDFYRDWYRPNLMAIIAVGDIDIDGAEKLIRDTFGDLENPANPRPREAYGVPAHKDMLASVATDPEQSFTQTWVAFKHPPAEDRGSREAYRNALLNGLFSGMLTARLSELSKETDPPFLFGVASPGGFVRGTDMFSVAAGTKEEGVERGLKTLMTEIARVRAHGFTQTELERAKADYMAGIERAFNERDKTDNGAYAAEYIRNFLEDEPIPGIEAEYEFAKQVIPAIPLDEVNRAIDVLVHEDNTVIVVSGPEKEGVVLPTKEALLAVAAEGTATTPEAYDDAISQSSLMSELPKPGKVVKRGELADLGITTVELSNGVEVWMKPTNFKNDQIIFAASVPGGFSTVPEDDFRSASLANQIVSEAGVGGLTPVELDKLLAGKLIGVSPTMGLFSHGIRGSSTPKDIESALQAMYLTMTQPNKRPESFEVLMERIEAFVKNRSLDPNAIYSDRLTEINTKNHPLFRPWTTESLKEVDSDKALAFYNKIMRDAGDLRFYFVGALDVETMIPLLETYVGSLPTTDNGPPKVGKVRMEFPGGITKNVVQAGQEPKSTTTITWPARASYDEMEMFNMRLATDILEIRLREVLREALGNTYGVGVGYSYMPPYDGYATTVVRYGSAPENASDMAKRILEEIKKFKAEGPTEEEVAKAKELEQRAVEKGLEENGYWLASLQTLGLLGWDANRVLARLDRIDEVSAESMHKNFKLYFPEDNYTVITLMPKESTP